MWIWGVCDKCALIVLGATFSLLFSLLLASLKSGSIRMEPSVPHRRISETPANAGCYNSPAGVSVSPPTDDGLSADENDSNNRAGLPHRCRTRENCACGTWGVRLRNVSVAPKRVTGERTSVTQQVLAAVLIARVAHSTLTPVRKTQEALCEDGNLHVCGCARVWHEAGK